VALAQWFESVINRAIEAQAARLADDDTRRRQTPGMHALLEQMRRGELVNDSNLDARLSRIEQLAAHPEDEFAWVCADCGQRIAAAAGFRVPDPFVNTAKLGNCGVCGQFGSINPSYDWTGRGD
jgi:hypothetical protein